MFDFDRSIDKIPASLPTRRETNFESAQSVPALRGRERSAIVFALDPKAWIAKIVRFGTMLENFIGGAHPVNDAPPGKGRYPNR